jgi:hypothetical protein
MADEHRRPALAYGRQALAGALVTAVLIMVFMLYTRPNFLVQLSDQLWSCF